MNEMTTFRWSFEEDVKQYKAAGIPSIGIWRRKLADFGEERGIDLLADSGLAVSNVLWAGGFTGSEGQSYRESIEDAEDAIRLAAAMQAQCLIVYTGARNGHTPPGGALRRAGRTRLVAIGCHAGRRRAGVHVHKYQNGGNPLHGA